MSSRIRKLLSEVVVSPSTEPDTMSFWHGGNLDEFNETISQKNGRYEYGPGLYLTTHYNTALKYSKGRRRLYLVTVQKGIDLRDAMIDMHEVKDFINSFVIGRKKKEVIDGVSKRESDGMVPAYMFGNTILNSDAISPKDTKYLRQFYIDNGIDYEMVSSPFGWHEMMMVLYNMRKILSKRIVKSTDTIEMWDLPTTWS